MNRTLLMMLLAIFLPVLPAPAADPLRFCTVHIRDHDDMIGGEAFSFLAPSDWKISGGLLWRVHPLFPATIHLRAFNSNNLDQLESFPNHPASFDRHSTTNAPYRNAIEILKNTLLPSFRAELHPTIISERELSTLANSVAKTDPSTSADAPAVTYNAGVIRIEYDLDGQRAEEDLSAVLITTSLPADQMTLQLADRVIGLRAAKGTLDKQAPLFQTILASSRINLRWFNRYAQLAQVLPTTPGNQLRNPGEIQRIIRRHTHDEISASTRQLHAETDAAELPITRSLTPQHRHLNEYDDPVARRSVALPAGYRAVWSNDLSEYLLSNDPSFHPTPTGTASAWQPLKPINR
jgi:hypothetical protein